MARRWFGVWLGPMLLVLVNILPGFAQSSEEIKTLRQEIEALKEGQTAIQKELKEIKTFLKARQAHVPAEIQDTTLSVEERPFKGDTHAKLTLIEFSDYQCPFCARHVLQVLPQIERDYVTTGKVKYVFGDFPIESTHKEAFRAAEVAHCAGEQGKYWEMHDWLFANQRVLGQTDMPLQARALGLDVPPFQRCLESGKYAATVRKAMADGRKAGVKGTPTFFLGLTQPDGPTVKVLRVIRGAQAYPQFKDAIDGLLASQE